MQTPRDEKAMTDSFKITECDIDIILAEGVLASLRDSALKPCASLDPKTAFCKSKWLAHGLKHEGGHRYNADWSWA